MEESRTSNVKRNIFYSYLGTIITSVFSIIARTIFVYKLGADYLGVSGLFSNVLGILSFSEFGIGTAISFSLYRPIADNDYETTKSLLRLFKKAYNVIASFIIVFGFVIFPFLKYLVNTDIPMSQIKVFYFIFLFNTVSSYFVTYKTSYVSALQKNYIVTNAQTVGMIFTNILQIFVMLFGGGYLEYLLVACLIGLLQKIAMVIYLNKKFPILVETTTKPLSKELKDDIWKNVKALIVHKIGDVSVNQTDNIIVSSFISTAAVGVISNYITLNNLIELFTNSFFSSFTAGFGNMIAKENKEKQRFIFDVYDMLGFWIYGFVLVSFVTLAQPFVTIWLGKNMLVDDLTMTLFFVSSFYSGMTYISYNFKVAAGKFNEDKWVAFVQAFTNLFVSIISVKLIGLPGIYVGTLVSRMIVVIVRPYIVYRYILEENVLKYYFRLVRRSILVALIIVVLNYIRKYILCDISIWRFVIMCWITLVLPNITFYIICKNTAAFKDILSRVKKRGSFVSLVDKNSL